MNKRNGLTIGWANNGGIDQAPTSQITTQFQLVYVYLVINEIEINRPTEPAQVGDCLPHCWLESLGADLDDLDGPI